MSKEIVNFPDYTIDFHGTITSKITGKILKPWDSSGYEKVSLRKNNKTYKRFVHRLMAETFLSNPLKLPTVNHKNGIRNDNTLDNLEWMNYQQQELHKNKVVNKKMRGASFFKGKWISIITHNKKSIYLGRYNTKEEAQQVYFKTYLEIHGVAPW